MFKYVWYNTNTLKVKIVLTQVCSMCSGMRNETENEIAHNETSFKYLNVTYKCTLRFLIYKYWYIFDNPGIRNTK